MVDMMMQERCSLRKVKTTKKARSLKEGGWIKMGTSREKDDEETHTRRMNKGKGRDKRAER